MDYEERSSLWGLGAGTAAASGLGLSIYHSRNELLSALRVANRDVAGETANIINQLSKFNNKTKSSIDILDQHQAGLLSLKGNKRLATNDIASAAYESILSGRQVTHSQAYNAFKSIKNQPDPLAAYREAGMRIQELAGDPGILSTRMRDIISNEVEPSGIISSPGGFFGTRVGLMKKDLAPEAVQVMEDIQNRFSKAAGDNDIIKWTGIYNVKDVFGGKEITTPTLTGRIAGSNVKIPLANTGVVYGGENLTSRYIARGAYNNTGHTFNYIDRYTSMIEEVLLKRQSQSETNRSLHAINSEILGYMNDRDSAARSQAVWSVPEQVMPAGARVKARMISNQAVSLTGENFTEDTVELLSQKGLFPIGSADAVAKGTLYKGDIAEGIYGPLGRLFPIERQPLQSIRGEWGVTAQSKQIAANKGFRKEFGKYFNRMDRKIKGSEYDKLFYGGADILSAEAYSAPQLTTFYAKSGDLGFKNQALNELISGEEVVLNKSVADMMEYETVKQHKISLNEGFKINKDIAAKLQSASVGEVVSFEKPIGGGNFLGIDANTGKEIWSSVNEETKRTQVIAGEITGNNMATLYTREQYRLSEKEPWKFFSEESKYMGGIASDTKMQSVIKAAGLGDKINIAGQELEAIQNAKLLEKNATARINQQVEALSMFTANKLSNEGSLSMRSRFKARELLENPDEFLKITKLLNANQATAEFEINKNMVSLGNKFGFSKEEMGLTFGLMDTNIAEKLGVKNIVEESTGVIGLSKMRLGNPASLGVGGLGSIEQSGLRLLAMKGEEGQRMSAELVTRLQGKGEYTPINRMLNSVINQNSTLEEMKSITGSGVSTDSRLFTKLTSDELLSEEGRFVDLGKKIKSFGGASKLYIPGISEAPNLMTGTVSPSGDIVQSETIRELKNLQGALKSGDDESIELAATNFRNLAQKEYESQGAARGKVLGSRFLTGFRMGLKESEEDAFKISPKMGESMFNELIESSSSAAQKNFLAEQKAALMSGETLTGASWRHPTTGPESAQFIKYKVDPNISGNLLHVPAKFGTLQIGDAAPKQVDISAMVGMKGDFDKDMFAISAIADRDTVHKVNRSLQNKTNAEYSQYLFNHYAMKDVIDEAKSTGTKTIEQMTRTEALQSGARNLVEAKVATPQVNLALQKLKLGVQYSAPEEYKPLSELFWHLEEAAIGGKHGTIGKVAGTSLYQNIARAVETKDVNRMEGVLTDLFKQQRTIRGSINGIEQSLDINPAKWAKTAIESAANISSEVDTAYTSQRIAKGTLNSNSVQEIIELMNRRKSGSVDVAQSLMYSNAIGKQGLNEMANRKLQQGAAKFTAVKRALSTNKKYALAGVAIAAGIGLMAPSISGSIPNPEGVSGGRNLKTDDMGPPNGLQMNAPQPRIQRSPEIHSINESSRANINMSLHDYDNNSDLIMANAKRLAEGGKVNIKTIDDRSALDSHMLARKIHERL